MFPAARPGRRARPPPERRRRPPRCTGCRAVDHTAIQARYRLRSTSRSSQAGGASALLGSSTPTSPLLHFTSGTTGTPTGVVYVSAPTAHGYGDERPSSCRRNRQAGKGWTGQRYVDPSRWCSPWKVRWVTYDFPVLSRCSRTNSLVEADDRGLRRIGALPAGEEVDEQHTVRQLPRRHHRHGGWAGRAGRPPAPARGAGATASPSAPGYAGPVWPGTPGRPRGRRPAGGRAGRVPRALRLRQVDAAATCRGIHGSCNIL